MWGHRTSLGHSAEVLDALVPEEGEGAASATSAAAAANRIRQGSGGQLSNHPKMC